VATGETRTVREFVNTAFSCLGLDYEEYVTVDPKFFRPTEKIDLCGNPAKIVSRLGWRRTKTFAEIVAAMIEHEMLLHSNQRLVV
jgi:GDPmannose 4,6-dehydratase